MFNKIGDYKNIEIAKIIQAIAAERKIDVNKIFLITKFALFEVFAEIYGKAKIDIEINKASSEIRIVQCLKVLSDEEASKTKYIFVEDKRIKEDESPDSLKQEDHLSSIELVFNYKKAEEKKDSDDFIQNQLERIENDSSFHYSTISLSQARKHDSKVNIGDTLKLPIANAWQNLENNSKLAKIFNKSFFRYLGGLAREQEFLFFSQKENQMINAFVKSANKDGYVLSYDNYEIILPAEPKSAVLKENEKNFKGKTYSSGLKSEIIPGEYFGKGERIQVFIKLNKPKNDHQQNDKRYQIIASRTHPGFLSELLKQNVPEIRDGQILIKDVQRIPGVRAKVVVFSTEPNLDPIGSCIGIRGIRIKSVSKELRGEKIDIINYSDNISELAANALYPIKAIKIIENELEDERMKLNITVDDKDLSSAIGKGGSNIKLISRIIKAQIEIIGASADEARRISEYQKMLQDFKEKLDIEEVIAQILIMNNFKTVDDIALANLENLAQIEYFDEEIASELQNRALEYIYEQEQEMIGKIEDNLKELIIKFDNEDQDLLKLFAEKGIFFLKDLAELDIEELLEKFDDSCEEIPEDLAEELIVSARKLSDFKIE